jgi:ABC-type branched-subunit amino acid transport system substrate-binding protein
MKKSFLALLIIALLGGLIAAGCEGEEPAPEKTLRIGALLATTGWWTAAYDASILAMTEIAVEKINEQGGITVNGDKYKVELVVADTKSDFDRLGTLFHLPHQ